MTMTTCRELIGFLDDYVAGELAPLQHAAFTQHLALCASCRAHRASYRTTILAAHAEIEDVPPEILTAILATITSRK
jgi:anti-sigma factor RsiW